MALSLKESHACAEMAKVLYNFLPGSGFSAWKGHISFQTVAEKVGVGAFWQGGSKEPAIAGLLERTLEHRRELFEPLILEIVKAGLKYRGKTNNQITEQEIQTLNGLILQVGFKFPTLWDPGFLASLKTGMSTRASQLVEQELKTEKIASAKRSELEDNLLELKEHFYDLQAQEDRQLAGLTFERVLNQVFELFQLKPREPFRIAGEQIDGSFKLDNEVYLLEAKWESKPLSAGPLMIFREKVAGKSTITRGVFVALNGCTSEALEALTRGKQPNFFILDGYDFSTVLEGRITLDTLLRAKIRRLAEEGKVFFSAREILI
jgi:hypothetical protein